MLRIILLLFLFSMACMGQTFQYSRGWTNGKRSGGTSGSVPSATVLTNLFHKDDETAFPELFDMQDANERRLERCLFQLQHLVRNPLLLHSAAGTLALNPPFSPSNANQMASNINNSNNNSNNNNNPFARTHQSNELFEELSSSVIDANDYGKH